MAKHPLYARTKRDPWRALGLVLCAALAITLPLGCNGAASKPDLRPVITLLSPVGEEVLGGTASILWNTQCDRKGTVEIRLSTDGGATFHTRLAQNAPDVGSYSWNSSTFADGSSYRIRVTPTNIEGTVGLPAESAKNFTIDNTAPVVTLSAPVGGETWSTTQPITWTTDDVNRDKVDIVLSTDSGVNYVSNVVLEENDDGSFDWDTSTVRDDVTYRIRIVAKDKAGNRSAPVTSPADFAVANAPKVAGHARFTDENRNGIADKGDQIVVPFNQDVRVNGPSPLDFRLPVEGDGFGDGAFVDGGPAANEVTITLGTNPSLITRLDFSGTALGLGSPSGIDISAARGINSIESATTGRDAVPSTPIDIVPSFVDSAQSLGNQDTRGVALGDTDGDGDLDLVVANEDGQNRIWLNDGAGNFMDGGPPLGEGASTSVALGDLDGDGDLDVVIGNRNNQANLVWINAGGVQAGTQGTFTDSGQLLGSHDTRVVVLGDLDGDNDLDLVTGNYAGQNNRVWLNDGTGLFTATDQLLGESSTSGLVLADLDTDGDLDIATVNWNGPNRVWINQGRLQGGFPATFLFSGETFGGANALSLAVGDIDRDSDPDIVVGHASGANKLWLNNGNAHYTDSGQSLGSQSTYVLLLADTDGDDDLDLIAGNDDGPNRIYVNVGGVLTNSTAALGTSETMALALGDVNGDGDLDIVSGNYRDQGNRVYGNSLAGTR